MLSYIVLGIYVFIVAAFMVILWVETIHTNKEVVKKRNKKIKEKLKMYDSNKDDYFDRYK
ncbi:MAG TPA: hypothetical protein DHM42_07620 [Clostridiales bacterium]|jgi:hypothetical protein|nr:hypothetical protein [Clostridiales bacterium]